MLTFFSEKLGRNEKANCDLKFICCQQEQKRISTGNPLFMILCHAFSCGNHNRLGQNRFIPVNNNIHLAFLHDTEIGDRHAAGTHGKVFTAGSLRIDITGFHGFFSIKNRINAHFLSRSIISWVAGSIEAVIESAIFFGFKAFYF
jgi:hypothetical protein